MGPRGVGPRGSLDDMEEYKFLPPLRLQVRFIGCSARRQSLYRLRYPGSDAVIMKSTIFCDVPPCSLVEPKDGSDAFSKMSTGLYRILQHFNSEYRSLQLQQNLRFLCITETEETSL
jgi:hypothetical protein